MKVVLIKKIIKHISTAGIIDRPYSLEVEFYDVNGNFHKKEIKGFEATVFCHEYDHLNGIFHMDRTNKLWDMTLDDMREFRKTHKQEVLSKTCQYKDLLNKE